jgi:hypothetical protein
VSFEEELLKRLSMQEREERLLHMKREQEMAKRLDGQTQETSKGVELALEEDEDLGNDEHVSSYLQGKMGYQQQDWGQVEEEQEQQRQLHASNSLLSVIDRLNEEKQDDSASITSAETSSSTKSRRNFAGKREIVVSRKKDSTAPLSKVREKLKGLNSYVLDHTSRKIMVAWNTVEARFQRSSLFKTEIVKDASGLSHPIKHPAIYLNALTSVLCSVKVRVVHTELAKIYSFFKCTDEDILHSRRVSAIRLLLGPNNGAGLKQAPELQEELQRLLKERDEILVSIDDLKNCVFPRDSVQLLEVEKNLQQERNDLAEALVLEKKKKEEQVLHNELRKQKALGDWDSTLKEIQFVKGKFSVTKHESLKDVIKFAEQSVAAFHAAKDLTIPHEIIHLLGWEAFPQNIIEYLEESDKKIKEGQMQKRDSAMKKKELLK